jgi:anhydro-N-acetylmuramic acid kinase
LFARVAALCPNVTVTMTDELGIPSGHVEAAAFAWLAMKCVRREPLDLVRVTGARGPRILGAIYPA